jgi:hypothetical protein
MNWINDISRAPLCLFYDLWINGISLRLWALYYSHQYTDKNENKIFLIYSEIQSGAVAKSYMRKGFLIYEKMRKYFPVYEEAVSHM